MAQYYDEYTDGYAPKNNKRLRGAIYDCFIRTLKRDNITYTANGPAHYNVVINDMKVHPVNMTITFISTKKKLEFTSKSTLYKMITQACSEAQPSDNSHSGQS